MTDNGLVFVPVRHHSPACARLVNALFDRHKPARVLIEGPTDFNDRFDELLLPHRLPIAIYTWGDGFRAYYPFCVYSPEWQAIRRAADAGVPAAFIDRPWRGDDDPADSPERYADGALRRSRLIDALCRKLGVDDFDALWDTLFEIDPTPDVDELHARVRSFCDALRQADEEAGAVSPADLAREAFMRARIAEARARTDGPILIVTGGYHTSALDLTLPLAPPEEIPPRNAALTPYSYARLDGLTGYASGMPSPGYYQALWDGRDVLPAAVTALRQRKQSVSTADLIAAEAMARGLAALRGHARVWRTDLLDGARSALVKEVIDGETHPLLDALLEALRGGERGRLADGTRRPPLAEEIEQTLADLGLTPEPTGREIELDLLTDDGRARSRALHRIAGLGVPGMVRSGGTDFLARTDLTRLFEVWKLAWTPEFDAGIIEAAVYGATLEEAASARLLERANGVGRDAQAVAEVLLAAAQAGLDRLADDFLQALADALHAESDFARLTGALGHVLYLYRFDEALGTAGDRDLGALLAEAFVRGVRLLDGVGFAAGEDAIVAQGIAALVAAQRRARELLEVEPFADGLSRAAQDRGRTPATRGAAAGALWSLGLGDGILDQLSAFAAPERLGDFLTGLFTLARETVRAEPALMPRLDALLLAFDDDDFLAALPSLRLAFSFFPPREKQHLARQLLQAVGDTDAAPIETVGVDAALEAEALALEGRLRRMRERYGVRPFGPAAEAIP